MKLTSVWHGMTTTEGESKGNYEGINIGLYGMKEGYLTDANMGVCTKIDHSCCPCQLLVQHALYSIQCPCGPTTTSMTLPLTSHVVQGTQRSASLRREAGVWAHRPPCHPQHRNWAVCVLDDPVGLVGEMDSCT